MTRTLVGASEPERPRNEAVWTNGTTATAGDAGPGGNAKWLTLEVKINR